MTGPGPAAAENAPPATLHLCNTYRQLLLALSAGGPATVVYLTDAVPLDVAAQARLRTLCPDVRFLFLSDAALEARFANLPAWLPAILRRNLRLSAGASVTRPDGWQPSELAGPRFSTGYFYHSGFFTAKVLASRCDRVVLRESGMNNYATLPVPPLKAVLRLASGLPPRQQVWGEEPWVAAIEVEHPERLPAPVRAKGRRLVWAEELRRADPGHLSALIDTLVPDLPRIPPAGRTALILTQPLDEIGLCASGEKAAIYAHLAARLVALGYRVFVKNHPRETGHAPAGTTALPSTLPIEAWEFTGNKPFALAVAIHSAALDQAESGFATTRHQLFPTLVLPRRSLDAWCATLDDRLHAIGLAADGEVRAAP